jgi:phage baseplate assembly protein W
VLEGRGATMVFKPGSTLAATLGFGILRVWRGRTLAPGWTLIADPQTLTDRPSRWIVFDSGTKSGTDFVEITYTTVQQECRRCGGLGVEHDWRYTITGDVVEVRDEALLLQEVMKLMYTIQGSNPFNSWYGTGLINMVGSKIRMADLVRNSITSDIQQAFTRWQSIKRQQEQIVGQEVSDREYPYRLLAVDVQQSQQDPTVFFIYMTVQNRSGNPIDMARGIKVPQPVDLLGSTAAQGVLRQSLSNYVLTG